MAKMIKFHKLIAVQADDRIPKPFTLVVGPCRLQQTALRIRSDLKGKALDAFRIARSQRLLLAMYPLQRN